MKGKRAIITPENETDIYNRAIHSTEQRTTLAKKLQSEIKWQAGAPEIEVLEKKISKYRHIKPDDPEDKPWNINTLDSYPLPPEALPYVIKAWVRVREIYSIPFTIRQAKWVSRLCFVITDIDELISEVFRREVADWLSKLKIKNINYDIETLGLYELMTGKQIGAWRGEKILKLKRYVIPGQPPTNFHRVFWKNGQAYSENPDNEVKKEKEVKQNARSTNKKGAKREVILGRLYSAWEKIPVLENILKSG